MMVSAPIECLPVNCISRHPNIEPSSPQREAKNQQIKEMVVDEVSDDSEKENEPVQ
jgi:hypothetical protein